MQKIDPRASILIPTLNEEGYVEDCINSLIKGMANPDQHEILVIDGGSTDSTTTIVDNISKSGANVRLLHNPNKIVPSALNIGSKEASHDYLVWCGCHAIYEKGYIDKSLQVHNEIECGSSGGVITPIGKSTFGKLVAQCTQSKLAGGGAPYRHTKSRTEAISVFGGCFTKETFAKVGGLNERWVRNQDLEFNSRIRKLVGPIIVDPGIRSKYYCRESLRGLANQYYQYGFWRYKTTREFPDTFNLKLSAPIVLVVSLLVSILLALATENIMLAAPLLGYWLLCWAFAISISGQTKNFSKLFAMSTIFGTIHISWGAGFLSSMIDSAHDRIRRLIKGNH